MKRSIIRNPDNQMTADNVCRDLRDQFERRPITVNGITVPVSETYLIRLEKAVKHWVALVGSNKKLSFEVWDGQEVSMNRVDFQNFVAAYDLAITLRSNALHKACRALIAGPRKPVKQVKATYAAIIQQHNS